MDRKIAAHDELAAGPIAHYLGIGFAGFQRNRNRERQGAVYLQRTRIGNDTELVYLIGLDYQVTAHITKVPNGVGGLGVTGGDTDRDRSRVSRLNLGCGN